MLIVADLNIFLLHSDIIHLTYLKYVSLKLRVLPTLNCSAVVSKKSGQTNITFARMAHRRPLAAVIDGFVRSSEFWYSIGKNNITVPSFPQH